MNIIDTVKILIVYIKKVSYKQGFLKFKAIILIYNYISDGIERNITSILVEINFNLYL